MTFKDLPAETQQEIIDSLRPNAIIPDTFILCGDTMHTGLLMDPLGLSPQAAIKRNPQAFIELYFEMKKAYQEYSKLLEAEAAKRAQLELFEA